MPEGHPWAVRVPERLATRPALRERAGGLDQAASVVGTPVAGACDWLLFASVRGRLSRASRKAKRSDDGPPSGSEVVPTPSEPEAPDHLDGADPPTGARTAPSPRRELADLALLFVVTRVVLVVIGLVARAVIPGPVVHPQPAGLGPTYSRFAFLDVWGQWDSSWYLSIAAHGYRPGPLQGPFANYAFFPLYPLLSRWVGWGFGSPYVGGLVVSNVSFLVACVFLYRLVTLDHDPDTARRAVKYLFAAPTAFLFSAMLSESVYLALVVMCFYFARRRRWWVVAALGFLVALSRAPGVLLAAPLAWIYFQQRGYSIRRIRLGIVALVSFPLGLGCFVWFNKHLTGDPLAFLHIQTTAWHHRLESPLSQLARTISSHSIFPRFAGWFALVALALILVFLKKMGVAYGVFALSSVLLPLTAGGGLASMPRYAVVIFPLYIVAARFTERRPGLDQSVTIGLAMVQGFLMVFWANNSFLVV